RPSARQPRRRADPRAVRSRRPRLCDRALPQRHTANTYHHRRHRAPRARRRSRSGHCALRHRTVPSGDGGGVNRTNGQTMSDVIEEKMLPVNGVSEPLDAATVAALLAARDIAPDGRGVAVAVNGALVRRADWATTALSAGDTVEIVRA